MAWVANPEVLRNARAQLRAGRTLSTALICGVVSLVVGYTIAHTTPDPERWGAALLRTTVYAQVFLLLIVGGLAALQAIQREKDLNTFDFQRITRLTSLELAAGKLFGAPIFAYFIALCFLPAAVAGAVAGRADPLVVLVCFAIVLLGAIGFHAFALVLSLLVDRSTAIASVLLLLYLVAGIPSVAVRLFLNMGTLSPSYAVTLITSRNWTGESFAAMGGRRYLVPPGVDLLFGRPVPHAFVLLVLYTTFAAWCLLALARNIKRDPAVYEIFTPRQALGFVVYVNLIVFAFFDWSRFDALAAHGALLGINAGLFLAFALVLLRNRDRVRRLLERRTEPGWVAATWPAAYVLPAAILVGIATVAAVAMAGRPGGPWDPYLAMFRVAVFAAWLLRDTLYLQWRNLGRGRRPLLVGLLYLAIFYACVGIVSVSLHLFGTPAGTAYVAILAPSVGVALSPQAWMETPGLWVAALCVQSMAAAVFVWLNRRILLELSAPAAAVAAG